MTHTIYAWANQPDDSQLQTFLAQHPKRKTLIIGLPENRTLPAIAHSPLQSAWQRALACVQFQAANIIADFAPQTDVYLMPQHLMAQLSDYSNASIHWQTQAIVQHAAKNEKAWQRQPENPISGCPEVVIIGAGIAGAATAYELARRGAQVTVLEARAHAAQAASGNQQGLLYAKISPHLTPQTELLLAGYGYTQRLLQQLLPEQETWQACGVLHINHDSSEQKRNHQLAQHTWHAHLYRAVDSQEATRLANFSIQDSGLFWQHGAWLNPPSLVRALLAHPNIRLFTQQKAQHIQHHQQKWHVQTEQGKTFSGSHIIFCTGAESIHTPLMQNFPTQLIRGQTSIAHATSKSSQLNIALSGKSYISPAWKNQHCFGASFINNDAQDDWRAHEQISNWAELQHLNPELAQELALSGSLNIPTGHAAIRCDSHDHLPIVGALGDAVAMRQVYAKLALDKNYRLNTPCPYLPNAYANTAHGSRGLATAPICAAQIAAEICGTPQVFSQTLRHALQPNRLIIRQIIRGQ